MAASGTSLTLIARRYAEALFALADGAALDRIVRDLTSLRALIADSADLRALLASPLIDRVQQADAIDEVATKAGLDPLTQKFLGVLATNRRLFALEAIAAAFLKEVALRRGQTQVEVRSARALNPKQVAALESSLAQALGGKPTFNLQVEPALLGGLVIRVGSKLIDASVKSRLNRLGQILKTAA